MTRERYACRVLMSIIFTFKCPTIAFPFRQPRVGTAFHPSSWAAMFASGEGVRVVFRRRALHSRGRYRYTYHGDSPGARVPDP